MKIHRRPFRPCSIPSSPTTTWRKAASTWPPRPPLQPPLPPPSDSSSDNRTKPCCWPSKSKLVADKTTNSIAIGRQSHWNGRSILRNRPTTKEQLVRQVALAVEKSNSIFVEPNNDPIQDGRNRRNSFGGGEVEKWTIRSRWTRRRAPLRPPQPPPQPPTTTSNRFWPTVRRTRPNDTNERRALVVPAPI